MKNNKKEETVANFRYKLIAPIVSRTQQLKRGEIKAHLEEAARKEYDIPYSEKSRVSTRSLERYLKAYREGGWEALKTGSRKYKSRIPEEYIEKAIALKKENPKRPIDQIIATLEGTEEVPEGVLKRSTLYDHFKKNNLTGSFDPKAYKSYQRFEAKERNTRWQGDFTELLFLKDPQDPQRKKKVHLILWLDDYSRLVTHAQCYFDEKLPRLEDSLKKAIIKFGKPQVLYLDNARVFSSHHLQRICGKLGIKISHTRPYRPQGRGKCERLFGTIKRSFLSEIHVLQKSQELTLQDINSYLDAWIAQHYHEKVHSSTKQAPFRRFQNDDAPLQHVDLEVLYDAFLYEEKRVVDKTGTISLNNVRYQVDLGLVGKKITLRYDPFSPETLQVHFDDVRFKDATILDIPEHVDYQRQDQGDQGEKRAPTSNISFLNYLKKVHEQNGLQYHHKSEGEGQ